MAGAGFGSMCIIFISIPTNTPVRGRGGERWRRAAEASPGTGHVGSSLGRKFRALPVERLMPRGPLQTCWPHRLHLPFNMKGLKPCLDLYPGPLALDIDLLGRGKRPQAVRLPSSKRAVDKRWAPCGEKNAIIIYDLNWKMKKRKPCRITGLIREWDLHKAIPLRFHLDSTGTGVDPSGPSP